MSARQMLAAAALLLGAVPPASAADPVARGLALQARAGAVAQAEIGRLQRAAAAAAASNAEIADPSTHCTVSTSGTADAALAAGRTYSGATLPSYVRMAGGAATFLGGGWIFPAATSAPGTPSVVSNVGYLYPAGSPGKMYNAWGWSVSYQTDTATRSMIHIASAGASAAFRVQVDGRYVPNPNAGAAAKDPIPYVGDAGGNSYVVVDCGSGAAPRAIRFEGAGGQVVIGVAVPMTASIARPTPSADQIVALATGDSYSEGQGETYPGLRGWPQTLGRLLGWTDVRQVAVGTTGVLATGMFGSRIRTQIPNWLGVNADLTGAQIDVVTFAPGYNDAYLLRTGAATAAALQAEYLADLRLVRATCPKALVVVFGSGAGRTGPDAFVLQAEAAAQAAYAAWGDARALWVPISGATPPWLFGTGRVGATNGSGNSDVAVAADGVHPSDLGHQIYARRAAAAIRAGLAAR